jgi:protocatechuate 3,4-dioxygenase beta subunit
MSRRLKKIFNWCPAPEPPRYNFQRYSQSLIAFITMTVLIGSIVGAAFFVSNPSIVAPLVDSVAKSLHSNSANQTSSTTNPVTSFPESFGSTNEYPASTTQQNNQSTYKVSGYVTDSSGNGISGAEIIFCVPDIIPSVFTDNSGYYQVSAPAGTYHVYVWPPFDSSYISFEQKEFVVNADKVQNVTLNSGYKLSGYITDSVGKPVSGAIVEMGEFFNGYYSTVSGYYYVVGQPGTYTLLAHPKTGVSFATYTENNFVFSGNAHKNITISSQTSHKVSGYVKDSNGNPLAGAKIIFGVPDIIPSVLTNNLGYYEVNAPPGTYTLDIWPPFDSRYLSYEQSITVAGVLPKNFTLTLGYKIFGYITDSLGNPVSGALVSLGNHISGWYSTSTGYYFSTAPAGTYTLTAYPRTGPNFSVYTESNVSVSGNVNKNINVGTVTVTTTPTPSSAPTPTPSPNPTQTPSPGKFVISGYVRDANGNGLVGAQVLLPGKVEGVFTDSLGFYQISAPPGTYQIAVYQPFDSNYLGISESNFVVDHDTTKNFVLTSAFKVSGYITDSSGNPISGAIVSIGSYTCCWYSKSTGYYFATAPAGTYTLTVRAVNGPSFTTYTLNNFVVSGDAIQNIVVTR